MENSKMKLSLAVCLCLVAYFSAYSASAPAKDTTVSLKFAALCEAYTETGCSSTVSETTPEMQELLYRADGAEFCKGSTTETLESACHVLYYVCSLDMRDVTECPPQRYRFRRQDEDSSNSTSSASDSTSDSTSVETSDTD
ncbi:uncharacterized protein [Diadema setosum]|uniref:uncharacterized protein n=1 Tax=Diadema setosum TaxID=31175 RepID=UPI003B3B8555